MIGFGNSMGPRYLLDFEGEWRINREIIHADGTVAKLIGTGTFARCRTGLVYDEKGELRMQISKGDDTQLGSTIVGTRRYYWDDSIDKKGTKQILVRFSDGRNFHHIPLSGGTALHWCDPDQYNGNYFFSKWPKWSTQWGVLGPRKCYSIVTQYRR